MNTDKPSEYQSRGTHTSAPRSSSGTGKTPECQSRAQDQSQSEFHPGTLVPDQSQAQFGSQHQPKSQVLEPSETQNQPGTKSQPQTNAHSQFKMNSQPQTTAQPQTNAQYLAKAQPQVNAQQQTTVQPQPPLPSAAANAGSDSRSPGSQGSQGSTRSDTPYPAGISHAEDLRDECFHSTLNVDLGPRSYPITIGINLDCGALARAALPKTQRLMVVSNTTVAPLYLDKVCQSLTAAGFETTACIIPDGEQYKTAKTWMQILTRMLEEGLGRDAALAALGGGVTGDVTGFAAACYQRGIDFIQLPTTLLAMVDSAVGGKTAVNHELGKNMIGAFHQPRAVIADLLWLQSLPDAQITAGLGEVIKTAVLGDAQFYDFIAQHASDLRGLRNLKKPCSCETLSGRITDNGSDAAETLQPPAGTGRDSDCLRARLEAVRRCCAIKAAVVRDDECESGRREHLNLGHTFAHAIETFTGYGSWLHGHAVGLGTLLAARLSVNRGYLSHSTFEQLVRLSALCGEPVKLPAGMSADDFIRLSKRDKKARGGRARYVLPLEIGRCGVFDDVSDAEIRDLTALWQAGQEVRA